MLDQYWYPLAFSNEVSQKCYSCSLFGKALVLFRGPEGLSCFEDLCPHRNVPLSIGKFHNGKIICAYHGWKFNLQGNITDVPSIADKAKFPKKCLRAFRVIEQDGIIWGTLAENPTTKPFKFPELFGYSSFEIKNTVKASMDLVIENFVDCAHTPFVHAGLFRSPGKTNIRAEINFHPMGLIVNNFGEHTPQSVLGKLLGRNNQAEIFHTDEYIIPSTVKVDYKWAHHRHVMSVSICTPINKTDTIIFTRVYLKSSWAQALSSVVVNLLTRKILAQDKVILNAQAQAIAASEGTSFTSVASDGPINMVRTIYRSLEDGTFNPDLRREVKVEYQI